MTIYLDLLFILNIIYDFLILVVINIVLKRNIKIKRIILGSLAGGLTVFLFLLKINYLILFLLKIIFGVIMVIITFGYRSIKSTIENLIYLYMISVILGGFLYYLSLEFKNANYLLLLFISPIILGMYINEQKKYKKNINYKRSVKIKLKNNKIIELDGFIDSGNRLRDPVTKKYIILINKKILDGIYNIRSPMYVPIKTVNKNSLIECISIKELIINEKRYSNYLLGLTDNLSHDFECLLNYNLLEEET